MKASRQTPTPIQFKPIIGRDAPPVHATLKRRAHLDKPAKAGWKRVGIFSLVYQASQPERDA